MPIGVSRLDHLRDAPPGDQAANWPHAFSRWVQSSHVHPHQGGQPQIMGFQEHLAFTGLRDFAYGPFEILRLHIAFGATRDAPLVICIIVNF